MAKGNPFLGTVSGSFGDLTLKNYRGKQVLSRKSTKPHDPRTSKQIYQRMFFATVSKARNAMKSIVDHSFENVPHGVDSLSYFTKRNIALLRENVNFSISKQAWLAPDLNFVVPNSSSFAANPYVVSEGSLTPFSNIGHFLDSVPDVPFERDSEPDLHCSIPFFDNFSFDGGETHDDLVTNLCDIYDILPGDYITAVFLTTTKPELQRISRPFNLSVHFVRFKAVQAKFLQDGLEKSVMYLLPSNVDGDNLELPSLVDHELNGLSYLWWYGENGDVFYLPYIDMSASSPFVLDERFGDERLTHYFNPPLKKAFDVVVASTWVHSRPDVDKILTSSQNLLMNESQEWGIYPSIDLETAFDLWSKQGKAIGDAKYILEGGDV